VNRPLRNFLLIAAAVLVLGSAGLYLGRSVTPVERPQQASGTDTRRPIIQIVRQQPGLPSLADAIASLCPSIANIIESGGRGGARAAGFAISPDGWVIAATGALPSGDLQVNLGAGPTLPVSDMRSDPVSGLSILKTSATGLTPVPLADQSFPRVGDFGFAVGNPAGAGCSAEAAMIASDFLTDGGSTNAYFRIQPMGRPLPPGAAFVSADGQALGIVAAAGPVGSVLPGDVVADVADELLRNSLSPTVAFGFRAEDFDASVTGRLSASRSSGTAVALVQPKTSAARAGLQAGDIVVAVDGSPVASASELGRALDGAGKSATLDLARGDQRLTIAVSRVSGS
jgi:S1-C subfamily serine protease